MEGVNTSKKMRDIEFKLSYRIGKKDSSKDKVRVSVVDFSFAAEKAYWIGSLKTESLTEVVKGKKYIGADKSWKAGSYTIPTYAMIQHTSTPAPKKNTAPLIEPGSRIWSTNKGLVFSLNEARQNLAYLIVGLQIFDALPLIDYTSAY